MLSRLLEAHERTISGVRDAITATAADRDDGTNDLLMGDVLRRHELQVWFLAEHLVDTPAPRTDCAHPVGGAPCRCGDRLEHPGIGGRVVVGQRQLGAAGLRLALALMASDAFSPCCRRAHHDRTVVRVGRVCVPAFRTSRRRFAWPGLVGVGSHIGCRPRAGRSGWPHAMCCGPARSARVTVTGRSRRV